MFDVETLMVRMGYYPSGPFGPSPADEPFPCYTAIRRAYDRRSGNFEAWGWVCEFSYYRYEEGWGQIRTEVEVGIPDSDFERFQQTTL